QSFGGFNWGDGLNGPNVHFSFGIGTLNGLFPLMFMLPFIQGIFPLSFVASFFGNGNAENAQNGAQQQGGSSRAEGTAPGSRMAGEEEYLANIFKYVGIFLLVWLLFV
uniref:Uncharacterized protein n=1 Tax=Caenorhabditis japonica TaxID=281687 RepID=A0A8R1IFK8_CAEJA